MSTYLDFQVLSDFTYVTDLIKGTNLQQAIPPKAADEKLFCHYPFGYLSVWANGDITPCCVFYGKNLVMGNINTHTLKQVWDGDQMAALRDESLTGKVNATCRTCLLRRENNVTSMEAFAVPGTGSSGHRGVPLSELPTTPIRSAV